MAGTTPRTFRLADLPGDVSLSGVARGDLLCRGADKWNNLAPGTSGYFLRSNGAGADPSWASVSLIPSGENGQIQYNSEGAFAGAQRLLYRPRGSILTVRSGGMADVPVTVDGARGQTGNLTEWKVNGASPTYTLRVESSGRLVTRTFSGGPHWYFSGLGISNEYGGGYDGQNLTVNSGNPLVLTTGTGSLTLLATGGVATVQIVPSGVSIVPLAVRGITSQSGNLTEWQSVGGSTVYGTVSENGYFTTRKVAAPADAELSTSEAAFWFDDTAGAAKLMVKAKNASGTVVTGSITLT